MCCLTLRICARQNWLVSGRAENHRIGLRADFFLGSFRLRWHDHGAAALVPHTLHRHAGLWLLVQHGVHQLLSVAGVGLLWPRDSVAGKGIRVDRWDADRTPRRAGASDRISLAVWDARIRLDQSKAAGMVEI